MKNKSRALALLLSVVQIVIASMIIIFALHDIILYAINPTTETAQSMIFLFLIDIGDVAVASAVAYAMVGVFAISLGISIAALVVNLKWKNPKAVYGLGLASIFGFNLAAGLVMALSADKMNK